MPGVRVVDRGRARSAAPRGGRTAGRPRASEAADVEVVDDLLDEVARVLDEACTSRSGSPAMPSPPSTSWQKPWVVAIVAASKSASAWRSRSRRAARRPRAEEQPLDSSAGGAARASARSALDQPLAHALAQLAGRHPREGDEQQLVQRRALGDVARGQRGDRERLAGAGARLEHGHAASAAARRRRSVDHRTSRSQQRRSRAPAPTAPERGGQRLVGDESSPQHELVLGLGVLLRVVPARGPLLARAASSGSSPRSPRLRVGARGLRSTAAAARASRGRRGRRSAARCDPRRLARSSAADRDPPGALADRPT